MSNVVTYASNQPATIMQTGLIPQNMSEAIQLATMMAEARLVPKDLQKSPSDCLMVIQQAVRWQMDPFAVAQECSVVQGKLMHSGKLVAAVVNSRGNLAERLNFTYSGNEIEDRSITVSGRFQGEKEPRTVTVNYKHVKTTNMQWTKQPDQQLMYSGTRVWARRHAPELMLGVYSPEEFEESQSTATNAPVIITPSHIDPPIVEVPVDQETGEVGPHGIAVPMNADDKKSDWAAWIPQYGAALRSAKTLDELEAWIDANKYAFATLPPSKMRDKIENVVAELRSGFSPPPAKVDETEFVDDGFPEYIKETAEVGMGG